MRQCRMSLRTTRTCRPSSSTSRPPSPASARSSSWARWWPGDGRSGASPWSRPVSYTHLRAHETGAYL
eukprot:2698577-Pyramimonas_sp.AAC.1